jgi:hypothetical protein
MVADLFGQGHGVGTGGLVKGDHGARFVVHAGKGVVGLHAQFHPGDVFDFDLGTVRGGPDDDFAEFLGILQAVGQADRVGELGARRGRLGAELAARVPPRSGPGWHPRSRARMPRWARRSGLIQMRME